MPRYFFHLDRQGGRVLDEAGMPLPDSEAAWYQAVRSARDLIRAELTLGGKWDDQAIVIADEGGRAVDQVPLNEVAQYAM